MEKNYGTASGTGLRKLFTGANKKLMIVICVQSCILLLMLIGAYFYLVHPHVKFFFVSPKVYHGIGYHESGIASQNDQMVDAHYGNFLEGYEYFGFDQYEIVDFYYVDNSHRSSHMGEVPSFYVFDLDVGDARQELIEYITTIGVSCENLDYLFNKPDVELYILPGHQFSLRDQFLCAFSREGGYVRYMVMTPSMDVYTIGNIHHNLLWYSKLDWDAISGQ